MPPDALLGRLARVLDVNREELESQQRRFVERATPGEGYATARTAETGVEARRKAPGTGMLKVLDLFCGSGGFSHGFEQTGRFAVTAGIDLLPDRGGTFTKNHSYANVVTGDIRSFPIDRLENEALSPDIVIGGPPCQGFSSIRPFRMCTLGDPRNNLFEHYALIVGNLRPKWFVLENVVGLLTHGGGRALPELLMAFEAAGYGIDWRVLNAAFYGLPQNRERLVVVGNRASRKFEWPEPTHFSNHRTMAGGKAKRVVIDPLFQPDLRRSVTVMDAIGDLPSLPAGGSTEVYDDSRPASEYARALRGTERRLTLHDATAHSERMLEIIRNAGKNRSALPEGMTRSGFSSCYSRLDADLPSVTITVNFVHPSSNRCIHPVQDRALTPREGARLQGFPDSFEFVGTRSQVTKQIGNAVPPLLGRAIADAIARQW